MMKYSMYKTFACKYKTNVHEIKRRYCRNDLFTLAYETKGGTKTTTFYKDGFKRKERATKFDNVSELPQFSKYAKTNTLKQRVERHTCELCGKNCRNLVIHQVKKLKSPKNAPTYVEEDTEETKPIWICEVCGYQYEGDLMKEDDSFKCPICKKGKDKFYVHIVSEQTLLNVDRSDTMTKS